MEYFKKKGGGGSCFVLHGKVHVLHDGARGDKLMHTNIIINTSLLCDGALQVDAYA